MRRNLPWKEAIEQALLTSPDPLHYRDIAEIIANEELRYDLGATPAATVGAQISSSIKREGVASPYVRVSRGVYTLRSKSTQTQGDSPKLTPGTEESMEEEEQYDIISSFGMFWSRDKVNWEPANPKILGAQGDGADSVNFYGQLGIYLLYDGREVIYVGRSSDRPLGQRLREHTKNRMATRWDRFSWFGLRKVAEDGHLENFPVAYEAAKLIPALEAVLIEALEPRQNRRRGDDLAAVEYHQREDPEITNKKARELVEGLLSNRL